MFTVLIAHGAVQAVIGGVCMGDGCRAVGGAGGVGCLGAVILRVGEEGVRRDGRAVLTRRAPSNAELVDNLLSEYAAAGAGPR